MDVAEAGAVLADLLIRLHAVPPREAGTGTATAGTGTGPAAAGTAILHLDLHPLNVISTPDGPVVIDWTNTQQGPPALDWAMSALILAQVALDGSEPARPADELLTALLAHRPAEAVLDGGVMAQARAARAADPNNIPGDLGAAVGLVIARAG
jgi:Ser/Thr protein kinase RdoA (MazF antagonist)